MKRDNSQDSFSGSDSAYSSFSSKSPEKQTPAQPPKPFDAKESIKEAKAEFESLWNDSLSSGTVSRHSALMLGSGLTDKPVTPLLVPVKLTKKTSIQSPPPTSKLLQYGKLKRATSFHGGKARQHGSLPQLGGLDDLRRKSRAKTHGSLVPEDLQGNKERKEEEEEAKPRKRAGSMDDIFKHSWDYTPFFWSEKAWKNRHNKGSDASEDTLPKEPPPEVAAQQQVSALRGILKEVMPSSPDPPNSDTPTMRKKKIKTVKFVETVVDNESKIIETDLKRFDEIPFEERDHTDEDEVKLNQIVFETETTPEGAQQKLIVAGQVEKLVSRLADQRLPDPDFIKEFFYSYRNIIAPIKLLTLLIERFDFNLPQNATDRDVEYHNRYNTVVKLRVVNVVKKWLQNHYYDFMEENRLFNKLKSFIDDKVSKALDNRWALQLRVIIQEKHSAPFPLTPDSPLEMIEVTAKRPDSGILFSTYTQKKTTYNMCFWGFQLQNWMVAVIDIKPEEAADIMEKMIVNNIVFSIDPKEKKFKKSAIYRFVNRLGDVSGDPIAPENMSGKPLKFLDIHPLEVARQLALITHSIFLKITSRELTDFVKADCILKAYKCPWIDRLYKRVREVAFWVASEIVLCANASQRLTVVRRFLEIAEYCNKFQNYCDLSAIIGGLRLPAVSRLSKTWKALSKKKHYKMYQDMLTVLKTETIRDKIKKAATPVIPIFDLYTKDLSDIVKMPDTLDNGMINWKKLRQQAVIFEEIERTRNGIPYSYKPVAIYQNFLTLDCVILSEHDLMYYSQECEPDSQLV